MLWTCGTSTWLETARESTQRWSCSMLIDSLIQFFQAALASSESQYMVIRSPWQSPEWFSKRFLLSHLRVCFQFDFTKRLLKVSSCGKPKHKPLGQILPKMDGRNHDWKVYCAGSNHCTNRSWPWISQCEDAGEQSTVPCPKRGIEKACKLWLWCFMFIFCSSQCQVCLSETV